MVDGATGLPTGAEVGEAAPAGGATGESTGAVVGDAVSEGGAIGTTAGAIVGPQSAGGVSERSTGNETNAKCLDFEQIYQRPDKTKLSSLELKK